MRYKEKNPGTNMIVAWFQMLYLEVTGTAAPSRTVVTSAYASSMNTENVSSSKVPPPELKDTFRLKEFKPMDSALTPKEEGKEEEKVEEDAAKAMEDEEFEDNPKQTFDEDISP